MAVEARHLNLFLPQLNREIMNPIEANTNTYNTHAGYGVPLSGATTTTETLIPIYGSGITDSIPQKSPPPPLLPIKSESGLTYNLPLPRKRSRESINPFLSYPTLQSNKITCAPFSFLGQDLSLQIRQQQLDVDCLISQHMEKIRMEVEETRKRQARRIMEALEEGMMKRLIAKEEEIEKIGKLNWALEERVKSLCMENQLWRDLAQTNEAAANALRNNLEQVLAAQVKDDHISRGAGLDEDAVALMDDAQSSCGSSTGGGGSGEEWEERCMLANEAQYKSATTTTRSRLCRNCRKDESCVLLLPCRHLCLCAVCGSSLHACPICKATKNGTFLVNM